MNLENKIFICEDSPKQPSLNLAINRAVVDAVKEGKYDAVARVYTHTNGVILGYAESIDDVNQAYIEENDLEVIKRPSGGSAILVAPDLTLCYTLIFNPKKFEIKKDTKEIYNKITLLLAQQLGERFVVRGRYYIRVKIGEKEVPFAGHAMKFWKDIVQFDGIVHKKGLDLNLFSEVLNLRELFEYEGEKYIRMDGSIYNIKGERIKSLPRDAVLTKTEEESLKEIRGLNDLGISEDEFINHLYKTFHSLFPDMKRDLTVQVDGIDKYQREIQQSKFGNIPALGHCFVDFMEPEALIEVPNV